MKNKNILSALAVLVLLVFVAAGCQTIEPQQSAQPQPETTPQPETQPQAQEAAVSVFFLSAPNSAEFGQNFTVEWKVDSSVQKDITHTAIHYGIVSYPGTFSTDITPGASGYPSTAGLVASATVPDTFSATITAPEAETTFYYRAHAIVDGKNYWSDEKAIKVMPAARAEAAPQAPEQMPASPADMGGSAGGSTGGVGY